MKKEKPIEKTVWVNIYHPCNMVFPEAYGLSCSGIFKTEEGARRHIRKNNFYVGTFPIQVELLESKIEEFITLQEERSAE